MWMYAAVFLSAFVFDVIPLIAPPAWMAMLFLLVKFHLNPWLVVPLGVAGSTLGRYVTSLYMPKFAHKFVHRNKEDDLKFLGRKLNQKLWQGWLFVFLYTITPLSSTVLFLAAGVTRVKPLHLIPPFFCGKMLSDTAMILWGRYAVADVEGLLQGTYSLKGILTIVLGLVAVGGFLVIDWRSLLQRKKFKLNFKIWK